METIVKKPAIRKRKSRLFTKPLYESLHDYKVIFVITNVFFMHLMYKMWNWFEVAHATMSAASAGAYSALALACLGACKWAMEHSLKSHDSKDTSE